MMDARGFSITSREAEKRMKKRVIVSDFLIIPGYVDCDVGYTFFNEKHISVGVAIHIARQEDIVIQIFYEDTGDRMATDGDQGYKIDIRTSFGYAGGFRNHKNELRCINIPGWTIMDTYWLIMFVIGVATPGIPCYMFTSVSSTRLWKDITQRDPTAQTEYNVREMEQTIYDKIVPHITSIDVKVAGVSVVCDDCEVSYNLNKVGEKCILRLYKDGRMVWVIQLCWDRQSNVFPEYRTGDEYVSLLPPEIVNILMPLNGNKILQLLSHITQ